MKNIATQKDLQEAIHELEGRSTMQVKELRERLDHITQSVTPVNILKTAFHYFSSSPELKKSAINTAIGLGTGYVTRKLYVGKSGNILKKLAGTVVQFVVTNFVRKKAPVIRERISELAENNNHR